MAIGAEALRLLDIAKSCQDAVRWSMPIRDVYPRLDLQCRLCLLDRAAGRNITNELGDNVLLILPVSNL